MPVNDIGVEGRGVSASTTATQRSGELMRAILDIVMVVLNLYTWIIIAGAVLSWLIAFGVVNIRNDFVRSIWNLFLALTEPFLRPIRNFLPSTGGIDISPIILLLAVMLIERIIIYYIYPNVF
jgi:YggT family protein